MPPHTASIYKNLVFSEGDGGRHTRADMDVVSSRPNNIQVGEHLWMRGPRKPVEYHPVEKKAAYRLFASLWAVNAANLFFTLRIVALTILLGGMGWAVVLFIRNVASIVASTVSTASYIGAWCKRTVLYICYSFTCLLVPLYLGLQHFLWMHFPARHRYHHPRPYHSSQAWILGFVQPFLARSSQSWVA